MTDMLSTAVLFERVDTMDAQELDRLQAVIERRRRQLAGDAERWPLKHRRRAASLWQWGAAVREAG
jgi:hypothetical protein